MHVVWAGVTNASVGFRTLKVSVRSTTPSVVLGFVENAATASDVVASCALNAGERFKTGVLRPAYRKFTGMFRTSKTEKKARESDLGGDGLAEPGSSK